MKDDLLIFVIIAVVTKLAVIMFILYANAPVYPTESIKISLNSNIKNELFMVTHISLLVK